MPSRLSAAILLAAALGGCASAPVAVKTKLVACPPEPPPELCPEEGDSNRGDNLRDLGAHVAGVERDLSQCRAEVKAWRQGANLCAKIINKR